MTRHVALLRGIGPSDPNMRNDRLRAVCEDLGLDNVVTVQSSGNIVFDVGDSERADLEGQLEAAWRESLGFESTTIVRTCDELAALTDLAPFGDRQHGRESYLLVTFVKNHIEPTFSMPHTPAGTACTMLGGTGRELFTVTDATKAGSPNTMSWLEGEFGKAITSRTWLTVQRILGRCR
ncbi:DUF1697 domain-containing protein [Egibacter rhizosphaerae]|uniref:DUF1697 domain-containing protein n=1 Tax=Egibacter rhizosphaerae TaxID=1670831 RepID=A0A411YFL6_9ACTN|nr:DUF1697 domain-containing protein [Egibacter rhizosphaerae]QBI19969.1 DUF1697 domain-containing protein [Egibacter rhizosphaerae]